MATNDRNAPARARGLGTEHRASYQAEFGTDPRPAEVGDWSDTGWGEAWRELRSADTPDSCYVACRLAYLQSLFATATAE
jgi:hypothetical protein